MSERDEFRELPDASLVAAVGHRRQEALAEVYRRHGGPVFALARRLLNDVTLAEEVVQEVFLKLWNAPDRYDADRGTLRAFLLATTHGRSVDLIRAETARRGREARDGQLVRDLTDDVEQIIAQRDDAGQLRRALGRLPVNERVALDLAYFRGLTYRQVAERLGEPEGTVKSRIRSAMNRLRAELSADAPRGEWR